MSDRSPTGWSEPPRDFEGAGPVGFPGPAEPAGGAGYGPSSSAEPPYQGGGYPPQPGGYPPQAYPPQPGGYPPQNYPPQNYPPQSYPPQQQPYPAQPGGGGWPPQGPPGGGPAGGWSEPGWQQPPAGQPVAPVRIRTKPRVWPWLLGAFVLIIVAIGGCTAWVATLAKAPIDATNTFVAALDDGRLDDAYGLLCADTRATVTSADFTADHTAASRITGYTFASLAAETGQLTMVSGTIDIDGVPRTLSYGLQQEGGDWKVCSYQPIT